MNSKQITTLQESNNNQSIKYFQSLLLQHQKEFSTETESNYYILSTNFIQRWKKCCNRQQTYQKLEFNIDIVEEKVSNNAIIKHGLQEGIDYIIVNKKIMGFFVDKYKGIQIKRKSYIQKYKFVDVQVFKFKYLHLNRNLAKRLVNKQLKSLSYRTILSSRNQKVSDFLKQINITENQNQSRLWLLINKNQQDLQNLIKQKRNQLISKGTPILQSIGKLLTLECQQSLQQLLDDNKDHLFVYEYKYDYNWLVKLDNQGLCQSCRKYNILLQKCPCGKVQYCNKPCQENDRQYHTRKCGYLQNLQMIKSFKMNLTQNSRRGLTGLINLANTCYLNSCLQCLSHTIPLTNYFLFQNFLEHINVNNPLGSGGNIARAYASFIQCVWCGNDSTQSPKRIKNALGGVNPIFSNYQQHDVNEAFTYIVDGVRQDLNLIKQKPYFQQANFENSPQQQNFQKSWKYYLLRNQSIIVDIMTGIYRSKVTCPQCQKTSITFQPFINLSLPVVEEKIIPISFQKIEFYYSYKNLKQKNILVRVYLRQKSIKALIFETVKILNLSNDKSIRFYLVSSGKIEHVTNNTSFQYLKLKLHKNSQYLQKYQLFCMEYQPVQLSQSHYSLAYFVITGDLSLNNSIGLKRPFFLPKKDKTVGKQIYDKFLNYFYPCLYRNKNAVSRCAYTQRYLKDQQTIPFIIYLTNYDKNISNWTKLSFNQQINNIDQLCLHFTKPNDFNLELLRKFLLHSSYENNLTSPSMVKKSANLNDCLDAFQEAETLGSGNQWYCMYCKKHQRANKQMSIYQVPQILVIHFKRFKQKGRYLKEKNDCAIDFPHELDMTDFVIKKQKIQTKLKSTPKNKQKINVIANNENVKSSQQKYHLNENILGADQKDKEINSQNTTKDQSFKNQQIPMENIEQNIKQQQQRIKYRLYAVSNHYGSMNAGHYTAYAKNNQKWYQFNDTTVKLINSSQVVNRNAYMIFYERI